MFFHYCTRAALFDVQTGTAQRIAMPTDFVDGFGVSEAGRVALVASGRGEGLWIFDPESVE